MLPIFIIGTLIIRQSAEIYSRCESSLLSCENYAPSRRQTKQMDVLGNARYVAEEA